MGKSFDKVKFNLPDSLNEEHKYEPCIAYICRGKSTGMLTIVIVGYEETHFIDSKGYITYSRNDSSINKYLNERYEYIDVLKNYTLSVFKGEEGEQSRY